MNSAPSFIASSFSLCFKTGLLTAVFLLGLCATGLAETQVTTPKQQFGFNLGDDYHLANYRQLVEYWRKLEGESPRLKVMEIGKSEEGRTMVMGIISAPENLAKLEHYREISRRLARADELTDEQARALAQEGKTIVWVSGGLHASETLTAQQLMETVYQFTRSDAEADRIFKEVILLAVPANPDGIDAFNDWYMRNPEPTKRDYSAFPRLYQKYTGHDNNRDFYALTQSETKAMCRVMFRDWCPQIVFDHHQSGPPGTVMFVPPFRDPFNYNLDPRVINGVDALGAAIMGRFLAEEKYGVTVRSGTRYSTWFNGGLRSIGYFHNVISLLSETIGSPNPMDIPFNPKLQLPRNDLLAPIPPQKWHFRQSVDYSVAATRAVLDHASRHRFELLYGIYAMGRDAIAHGNTDHWTRTPGMVAKAEAAAKADAAAKKAAESKTTASKSKSSKKTMASKSTSATATAKTETKSKSPAGPADYKRFFQAPEDRDARAYILPADQPDFQTATRFINALLGNGVRVHRSTRAFEAAGRSYPEGSYVVLCSQAYRAHVLDMFEPQQHPNDLQYPGGPPVPPYDLAGWTLALQMNVKFDRVLEALSGPFEEIPDVISLPAGRMKQAASEAAGYYFTPRQNDSFRVANRLLAAGEKVSRMQKATEADGESRPAGTFYVSGRPDLEGTLKKLAKETGVNFEAATTAPGKAAVPLRQVRVGLWDRFGGSMPAGWTRWVLEQFEFPFERVFAPELDAGKLREKYDVLVFMGGAIPAKKSATSKSSPTKKPAPPPALLGEEFKSHFGSMTAEKTIPQLRTFLEEGGTVVALGSSSNLIQHLKLTVEDHLTESKAGKVTPLPREKFYIPGSIVRGRVDTTHPLAWGMDEEMDFMFNSSPVFRTAKNAKPGMVKRIAWYDNAAPLRSGWALGQEHLKDGLALFEIPVGPGRLIVCGPEILFRAQSHGTFKFIFNAIMNAGSPSVGGGE